MGPEHFSRDFQGSKKVKRNSRAAKEQTPIINSGAGANMYI